MIRVTDDCARKSSTAATSTSIAGHGVIPTQLKRSYDAAAGFTLGDKRLTDESDPESQEIKRLRQEDDLDFETILLLASRG